MASTSSTPTKPARLNERNRQGAKTRTLNADVTTIGQFIPDRPGVAYLLNIVVVGVRLLTAQAPLPVAYALSRRALFMTDASGVVTQQGATGTIGSDLTTDANISLTVSTDGTNINIAVSAEYPTDWSVACTTNIVDQFQVG